MSAATHGPVGTTHQTLTARDFIAKWGPGGSAFSLGERAGAQAHFIDLCQLLGVATPGDAERYCFERGLNRTGTAAGRTNGFADVWLKGHFAWEYKAPGKSLEGALRQLMMYALPLENPPLLVVSDRLKIEVHTHFTGTPSDRSARGLAELTRMVRARARGGAAGHGGVALPRPHHRQAGLRGATGQAHEALDAAVAAAYGWADYTPALTDDEILRRLLALNLARAQTA